MRGTLGGAHRTSIIDMIVDHHLARPGASPCPPPWLMKLIHTLQSRHLAHLDGLWLLWIVSGAQKVPKTSRKREWVDIQVNRVSESRIATPSTNTHHNRETPLVASCTQNRAVLRRRGEIFVRYDDDTTKLSTVGCQHVNVVNQCTASLCSVQSMFIHVYQCF